MTEQCRDDHCVTCSDEAVPLTVQALRGDGIAICDGDVEVMTDLLGTVEPGEVLLVHAGVALQRLERLESTLR